MFPYNPDIRSTLRNALLTVWQGVDLEHLITATAEALQSIEDAALDLRTFLDFDTAGTRALDLWGRAVQEPRDGESNERFREIIVAKVLATRSRGTISDLLDLVPRVLGDGVSVVLPQFPAAYSLELSEEEPIADSVVGRLKRFLNLITPAGVGYEIVEGIEGEVFRFDSPNLDVNGFGRLR